MKDNFDLIKKKSLESRQNILKGFTNVPQAINEITEAQADLLEKGGKRVPVGVIKTRKNGVKEIKTATGWEPYHDGNERMKHEEVNEARKPAVTQETSTEDTTSEEDETDTGAEKEESTVVTPEDEEAKLSQQVQFILHNVPTKKNKIKSLYKIGLSHDQIVNYTGFAIGDVRWFSREWEKENPGMQRGLSAMTGGGQQAKDGSGNVIATNIPQPKKYLVPYEKLPEISTKDRWDSYELFGKMICLNMGKSMVVYGSGGVGKTYTLMGKNMIFDQYKMRAFNEEKHDYIPGFESDSGGAASTQAEGSEEGEENTIELPVQIAAGRYLMKNEYDYVKMTGKVTATEMYKTLYENNGKVIIFDDCDEVLQDPAAINVLKGALDTTGDGTITWKVSGKIPTDYTNIPGAIRELDNKGKTHWYLPKRFKFQGQVLFISNLDHTKIPQPLLSRGLTLDLTMNADETAERLQQIYKFIDFQDSQGNPIEVSEDIKKKACDFISKYRYDIDMTDLNARTLGKIALIIKTVQDTGSNMEWEKVAASMLKKK